MVDERPEQTASRREKHVYCEGDREKRARKRRRQKQRSVIRSQHTAAESDHGIARVDLDKTAPAFSGTASEALPVTVEVFKGEKAEGKPVATISASVAGEHWSTAHLAKALEDGTYTAVASEPSSLEGNPVGHSEPATFVVDTKVPLVEITPPASPSKNTKPSFSGTVDGPAGPTVTVYIHEGESPQGKTVAAVSAAVVKGAWSTGPVEPALKSGRHKYTAVATASSSIGNGEGQSVPAKFEVNTEPPVVTLGRRLRSPTTRSPRSMARRPKRPKWSSRSTRALWRAEFL